jgi:hypothetical protein
MACFSAPNSTKQQVSVHKTMVIGIAVVVLLLLKPSDP